MNILELENMLKEAEKNEENNYELSISLYQKVIHVKDFSEEINKIKEQAIYKLGKIYTKLKLAKELCLLAKEIRPFFESISKAKSAKIVRIIIDLISEIPNTIDIQIDLCKENIEWAKETKRTFLRQRIETRLASLYLEGKKFQLALELINSLIREVKKFDDKLLLVEIHLIESKIHQALRNIPKARAALTSARTNANAIYCPPYLQTQLDLQSGILHAEEKDYKTAYSYFYESFEGFNSISDRNAIVSLKYMLLSKIMMNNTEDVYGIISGKLALPYAGKDIEAMKEIANAYKERSLKKFEDTKKKFREELTNDAIINAHLSELYDTLIEQNLCKIIEPFSVVEIDHIAELIQLPVLEVEKRLSQMILDKKLQGILDQGIGQLIIFEDIPEDKIYKTAIATIENMSTVVDSLYLKASKLA
jgi:26S proteasome regulatory subunit N6